MIKSFLSWGTALLVLCSGLLSSCDDKNEGAEIPVWHLERVQN